MSALLILIALAGDSSGDPPGRADSEVAAGQVVTELHRSIWCMRQARNGDYWFGSNGNGIFRYDGRRLVRYGAADGLPGDVVRDIGEDAAGSLLVATTEGVARFDGRRFVSLEPVGPQSGGAGWALAPDDVWLIVDPSRYGPWRWDGRRLYQLELAGSPAEADHRARYPNVSYDPAGVYSIHRDRRGHLWFGTASLGLCRYDGRGLSWLYEERLTTTPEGGAFGIRAIHQDRAGDYWISNTRQRFEVSPGHETRDGFRHLRYRKKPGLPDADADTGRNFTYFASLVEDEAGALWLACGSDGVLKYDGAVTHYPLPAGAFALHLYRDRSGGLWLGTARHGVFRFEAERFVPFDVRGSGD